MIAVGAAADRRPRAAAAGRARRRARCAPREELRRGAPFERWDERLRSTLDGRAGDSRARAAAKAAAIALRLLAVANAHVDVRRRVGRNGVRRRSRGDERSESPSCPRSGRRAPATVEHLVGELDRRVDALLRVRARHAPRARLLRAGTARRPFAPSSARRRRSARARARRVRSPRLSSSRSRERRRADLLVRRQHDGTPSSPRRSPTSASAKSSWTTPAFMSKTPGPVALVRRERRTASARASRAARRCPGGRRAARAAAAPNRQRRCVRPVDDRPARPVGRRARAARPSATDAHDSQASGSPLGDSASRARERLDHLGRRRRSTSTSAGEPFGIGVILRGSQRRSFGASKPKFRPQVLSAPTMPRERRAWNHQAGVTDLQTATSKLSSELAASAAATALSAADRAGVEIRLLDSVAEFEAASRLIGRIWRRRRRRRHRRALLRALVARRQLRRRRLQRAEARRCLDRLLRPGRRRVPPALAHHGRRPAPAEPVARIRPEAVPARLGARARCSERSAGRRIRSCVATLYFNLVKLGASDRRLPLRTSTVRCSTGSTAQATATASLLRWELASARAVAAADAASARPRACDPGRSSSPPAPTALRAQRRPAPKHCSSGSPTTSSSCARAIPVRRDAWREAVRLRDRSARARRRLPRRGDHARRLAPPARDEDRSGRAAPHPPADRSRRSGCRSASSIERDILLVRVVGPEAEGWGECVAFPSRSTRRSTPTEPRT